MYSNPGVIKLGELFVKGMVWGRGVEVPLDPPDYAAPETSH
jgi:hypothetical protein